jgi:2-methylaconitate cis-trans-isomerase PrpF
MRIKILNYIIYGIITLNLVSCESKQKNGTESKTELNNNQSNKKQTDNIKASSDEKLELELENKREFLIVGKPTKFILKRKNYSKKISKISTKGGHMDLEYMKITADSGEFLITAGEEDLLVGEIEIRVTEKLENKNDSIHKFTVLVKETE